MKDLGRTELPWRQVPFIIVAGLLIGVSFGQAIKVWLPASQGEVAHLTLKP
jgi:hypothetical protein